MCDSKKQQIDRFKEAAREIGTDDDEAKFNEKLGKLVKQNPKSDEKSKDLGIYIPQVVGYYITMDVSKLHIDDESMGLIVRSLALECHDFALLSGIPSHSVEDQLPLVFSVINSHGGDLLNISDVPAAKASDIAAIRVSFSNKGYLRLARAAKNRVAGAVNVDANIIV